MPVHSEACHSGGRGSRYVGRRDRRGQRGQKKRKGLKGVKKCHEAGEGGGIFLRLLSLNSIK